MVSDLGRAGLPAASVVRTAKIATIEARESEKIGELPRRDRRTVWDLAMRALSAMSAAAG